MKSIFLIIAAALLSSCATEIFEDGQPVMRLQSDAVNVTLQTAKGTYFHADVISNSTATQAGGQVATGVIGAAATGVVGGITAGAGHVVPAVIATAVPNTINNAGGIVRPTNINVSSPAEVVTPNGRLMTIRTGNGVQTYQRATVRKHRRHRGSAQYHAAERR
jgi:hypothetical protein